MSIFDEQREERVTEVVERLRIAVPLWNAEIDAQHVLAQPAILDHWRRHSLDELVVGPGAEIQRVGGRAEHRQQLGRNLDALARTLALASHVSGGVPIFGEIWCAYHSPSGVPRDGERCPDCPDGDAT